LPGLILFSRGSNYEHAAYWLLVGSLGSIAAGMGSQVGHRKRLERIVGAILVVAGFALIWMSRASCELAELAGRRCF
jgi:uncharacterized membrane protein YfcA